jgi:hypothetical protein
LVGLNLSYCSIGDTGIAALAKAIDCQIENQNGCALGWLNLGGNTFSYKGSKALEVPLSNKRLIQSLFKLDLSFTNPDFQILTKCENITCMDVSYVK